jgi:glycosyltransferase involved in cell wall biosynthesis
MVQKPQLIAFSHFKIGGVQNFFYNLLSPLVASGEFDILWIYEDFIDGENTSLTQTYGVGKEIVYKREMIDDRTVYDRYKRLSGHISNKPGVVITNFYSELSTLHIHRRSKKTVYFICHDVEFLRQAKEYEFLIDVFIAHNPQFYKSLVSLFPNRKNEIFYLPYGITIRDCNPPKPQSETLRIIFAARHVEHKGVNELPEIIALAEKLCINLKWTILGDGPLTSFLKKELGDKINVQFFSFSTNEEVIDEMAKNDVYLLPSYLDGLPVAMLEAMSMGCVPVMYKFNEGIKEILDSSEAFIVDTGNRQQLALSIASLYFNRKLLSEMSNKCIQKVQRDYDINKCVNGYKNIFLRYQEFKRPIRRKIIFYGGVLELPFIPAFLRKSLRELKKRMKSL